MFKPIFVKGSILKQNMLESLRDYPYLLQDVMYDAYACGIINGFQILSLAESCIRIGRGILKTAEGIYCSDGEIELPWREGQNYVYLEVTKRELTEGYYVEISANQYDTPQEDKTELFRYTYTKGAELFLMRNTSELLSSPMNRIDRSHVLFSYKGGNSLCNDYYKLFAHEVLDSKNGKTEDVAFAYQCLNGINDIAVVRHYFKNDGSNEKVLQAMREKVASLANKTDAKEPEIERVQAPKKMIIS